MSGSSIPPFAPPFQGGESVGEPSDADALAAELAPQPASLPEALSYLIDGHATLAAALARVEGLGGFSPGSPISFAESATESAFPREFGFSEDWVFAVVKSAMLDHLRARKTALYTLLTGAFSVAPPRLNAALLDRMRRAALQCGPGESHAPPVASAVGGDAA